MIVIGLTGSIGMGKSTAAGMLRHLGLPVHDADAVVHLLMAKGGRAVPAIEAAFPGVVMGGAVDRQALGGRVFGNAPALRRLEGILHPLVVDERDRFLAGCRLARRSMAVLDVPLLLETGGDKRCDVVVVVSAPGFLQRARVLARRGMTSDRLARILDQQMPDRVKRMLAHHVIPTGIGRAVTFRRLHLLLESLRRKPTRNGIRCGKSSSIRRRRAFHRRKGIASSKSAGSS